MVRLSAQTAGGIARRAGGRLGKTGIGGTLRDKLHTLFHWWRFRFDRSARIVVIIQVAVMGFALASAAFDLLVGGWITAAVLGFFAFCAFGQVIVGQRYRVFWLEEVRHRRTMHKERFGLSYLRARYPTRQLWVDAYGRWCTRDDEKDKVFHTPDDLFRYLLALELGEDPW